jgi:hypothetical protein
MSMLSIIAASRRRAFNPLSLSPALWLSDTGSSAATWPDISGNGRDATQATGGFQPTIVTGDLNGRQVRRFDGSNDRMDFATSLSLLKNISGATLFVVAKHFTASTQKAVFTATTNAYGFTRLGIYSNATPLGVARNNETESSVSVASTATANTPYIFTLSSNFAANPLEFFKNGASQGSANFSPTGNTPNTDSAGMTIGALRTGASAWDLFFDGDIAEILVFPTALSTADRQKVESYLAAKWGITLA